VLCNVYQFVPVNCQFIAFVCNAGRHSMIGFQESTLTWIQWKTAWVSAVLFPACLCICMNESWCHIIVFTLVVSRVAFILNVFDVDSIIQLSQQ